MRHPSNWIHPAPVQIPEEIQSLVGNDPLLGAAFVRRGITSVSQAKAFVDPHYYSPADASQLPDLDQAVERILSAVKNKEKIGIWGDFDVDGQTSTTLLVSALKKLGADVVYHIPIRSTESHGVNLPGLKSLMGTGTNLIITCDTGISAFEAAEACRSARIDLIITDHHTLSDTLPNAYAVVNPQRLDEGHPLSYLCGVGCAYKVIENVYQNLGRESETEMFLDLVALGTVADVALLKADNRFLVQKGIQILQNQPRMALKAIYKLNEMNATRISEEQIGFTIAPRMNALGRLSDANPMVSFLMSQDVPKTEAFAQELEKWNSERKMLCDQVFKAAQRQLELNRSLLDDPILVLSHLEWPTGVVGIVASRLVDLYHRPCILLATQPGQPARGSARSIEGINITQAIAAQARLLLGFGGHPMAAGLALEEDNIPAFRRSISKYIEKQSQLIDKVAPILIQAQVPLQDISFELVERLNQLAPFGAGNAPFIFSANQLTLKNKTLIGKNEEHLKLIVEDPSGTSAEVFWWQGAGSPLPDGSFNLAYILRANDFRGRSQVQIEWLDFQEIEDNSINVTTASIDFDWVDWRNNPPDSQQLAEVLKTNPVIWGEGQEIQQVNQVDRFHLTPNPVLLIWNIPPGIDVLNLALKTVRPKKVFLLGHLSAKDQPVDFLKDMAGIARFALREKQGWLDMELIAARMAQRITTVQKGVSWLCAKGLVSNLGQIPPYQFQIGDPSQPDPALERIENELKLLLKETRAYRQFYLRAAPEVIISAAKRYQTNS